MASNLSWRRRRYAGRLSDRGGALLVTHLLFDTDLVSYVNPLAGEVTSPQSQSVVYGVGSLRRLQQKSDAIGARRVMVVTTATVAKDTGLAQLIATLLGERLAGVFDEAQQHVPYPCIARGARMASELGADMLVSVGGGSVTDVAKGINLALAEGEGGDFEGLLGRMAKQLGGAPSGVKPRIPHVAVPTTLSGAEFSAAVGMTDPMRRTKFAVVDPTILPTLVILDPEATISTPAGLWTSTALKVVADCYEEICSPRHVPIADGAALHAIKLVDEHLIASVAERASLEARAMLQHASWMSNAVKAFSGLGLVAALRHQVGSRFNLPHGMTSSIVFAHGIGFNRPIIDERLASIGRALGHAAGSVAEAADAAMERAESLIRQAALPTRLRDVGVEREQLAAVADAVMHDRQLANNPRPVRSVSEIERLLQRMW